MKKFLSLALAVLMLAVMLPITALAAEPSGSIESAGITHANGVLKNAVSVDLKNVTFAESVAVKLYSGDTLLTTATLQGVTPGSYGFLTCCIATETADANWALTPWTPRDNVVPDKAVLVVDGHELNTKAFTLDADEWAVLPGTYGGSIERAAITHDNGVLKNAVSVDLKDVTFAESVAVKLYRGETLLTTATLKTGILAVDQNHHFVTCCIPTEGEDDAWSLTPWTPRDNVVPNKVVLFVDDNEMDTMEFNLDAAKWAALPGTVLPCSIESAIITRENKILKNAVSVELQDVTFTQSVAVKLYSDKTLLTTATLQGVNPGYHDFLTCCIATQTADEYWPLTPWTPKDDVVPNKAVLVVDGSELAEKAFTLNADAWADLPGTVPPSSGTIVIIPDRTEDTPKTEDQKNPSTGANDVVAAAVALMAVSALGMAVLTRKK